MRENDNAELSELSLENIVLNDENISPNAASEIFIISSDEEECDGAYGGDRVAVDSTANAAPLVKAEMKIERIKTEEIGRESEIRASNAISSSSDSDEKHELDEFEKSLCAVNAILNKEVKPANRSITLPDRVGRASQAPSSSVRTPLPVSCKLEYDDLSGFIPFMVDVSDTIIVLINLCVSNLNHSFFFQ